MLMMSHYELHDDELAWWHSSLFESHPIARVRHELIAAMRCDQLRCLASALWRCLIVLNRYFYGCSSEFHLGPLLFIIMDHVLYIYYIYMTWSIQVSYLNS